VKILYLAPNIVVPGSHGGSTHVTSVTRALRERGHDVLVVARRGSREPGTIAVGVGLAPVIQHLMPLVYAPLVLGHARRFSPDVIYERYSAFGLGVLLGRALRVPTVLMTLDRDASRISLAGAARIVATSDSFIPRRYRSKLRLVSWGTDPRAFEGEDGGEVRRALAPSGERVVVYTGSCATWHGLDVLVEAAASWQGPPAVFAIVGDGEDLARVRDLAASRRGGARVTFTGRVPHDRVAAYVAAADVCVAPYAPARHPIFRKHGMDRDPLKVLEYLAAGKPTITIDTPRMRALFAAGNEIVLVPPEDAGALGAALRELFADPARASSLATAGRQRVLRDYTWAKHAADLDRIFLEAIGA
jgi:glycosyltransferase involved in cell wall biosynthesis